MKTNFTDADKKIANAAAPLAAADLVSADFWAEVDQRLAASGEVPEIQPRPGVTAE